MGCKWKKPVLNKWSRQGGVCLVSQKTLRPGRENDRITWKWEGTMEVILVTLYEVKKLRCREENWFAQGCAARWWRGWNSGAGCLTAVSTLATWGPAPVVSWPALIVPSESPVTAMYFSWTNSCQYLKDNQYFSSKPVPIYTLLLFSRVSDAWYIQFMVSCNSSSCLVSEQFQRSHPMYFCLNIASLKHTAFSRADYMKWKLFRH